MLLDDGTEGVSWPRGVARAEAPWLLRGDAFVVFTTSSTETNLSDAGIPHELRGIYHNLFNVMLVADCRESPVGPYRELLYVPGRFRFSFDDERLSVTRSYISTQAGAMNRRANWNVPSKLSEISIRSDHPDHAAFSVGRDGFAAFSFELFGPELPINGKVIPEAFRIFGQLRKDVTLLHSLSVTGTMRAARFTPHSFDTSMFPDMKKRELIAAIKISDFLLELPAAQSLSWVLA
jgi:hypothetical protein